MSIQEGSTAVNLTDDNNLFTDKETFAIAHMLFVCWGICIPIIGLFGFIGNILTLLILFRKEMTSTSVYFLRTLVITDTCIIFFCILSLSIISITKINPDMWRFSDVIYPKMFPVVNYIVMTLQFVNVWVTVAVSAERYISICDPFKAVSYCSKKKIIKVITSIFITGCIYNFPRIAALTVIQFECGQHICFEAVPTDFGATYFFVNTYSIYLYILFIYVVPLSILLVLNTFLIIELMKMRNKRGETGAPENMEINMSVVLVLTVIVFILCQTPGLVAQFWFLRRVVLLYWVGVSNTLFVVNSSVNFLIYTAVGRKFRQGLLKKLNIFVKPRVREFSTVPNFETEMVTLVENQQRADLCDDGSKKNGSWV